MTYNDLLIEGEKIIKKFKLDISMAKLFLMESASLETNDFYININNSPSKKVTKKYFKNLNEYVYKNKPPQYILNKAYFYGNSFKVNKNVLIPRPETESLIDLVKSFIKNKNNLNIIDIGTGSGIISITLNKLFPENNYYASDISSKALRVAKTNNKRLNTNVSYIKSDLFKNIKIKKFDIIIANLPYVTTLEKIDEFVLKEPKKALFAGELGIDVYKEFFNEVFNYLNEEGTIITEHGFAQKELLHKIIRENNKDVLIETVKDINNKDRYTIVRRKQNE